MTAAFGFLMVGWLLLASATRNQPVAELLRGAVSPAGTPGPGERGFTTSILGELAGDRSAGGSAASSDPQNPAGLVTFDGEKVCAWIAAELRKARANGWSGSVTSGYRSAADQARVCATGVTPCAKPGESNHQGTAYPGCAVDVSDPAGLARALPKGSPLKYTGATIGDTPHFSSGKRGV